MKAKRVSWRQRGTIFIISILACVMAAYAVVQYGFMDPQKAGLIVQKLKNPDFHYHPWIEVIYVHIVTACCAMIAGPFGLFVQPKGRWLRPHRIFGYVYIVSIMISGIVSLYLSFFASGGWKTGTGFFILDILWMGTTWIALKRILSKQVQLHKEWMYRSYAMTFSAVTFRLWLIALQSMGVESVAAYSLSAWLCWIPNLLLMEWIIRNRRKAQRRQRTAPFQIPVG